MIHSQKTTKVKEYKRRLILGIVILLIIIPLYFYSGINGYKTGLITKGSYTVLFGIDLILISLLIIISYFFEKECFLFRSVIKMTNNIRGLGSNPKYSFFWASFVGIFGIFIFLKGIGIF